MSALLTKDVIVYCIAPLLSPIDIARLRATCASYRDKIADRSQLWKSFVDGSFDIEAYEEKHYSLCESRFRRTAIQRLIRMAEVALEKAAAFGYCDLLKLYNNIIGDAGLPWTRQNALDIATQKDHIDAVLLLISFGANPFVPGNHTLVGPRRSYHAYYTCNNMQPFYPTAKVQ